MAGSTALAAHAWKPGQSGNPAGTSKERRALCAAIDANEIPKVLTLLAQLYDQAMLGDVAAARLWLDQVRGPVKTHGDEEIERAVERRIQELISEARQRRMSSE